MFSKLALRNVRRQFSNYLIYFVTVTLTISMMFALCNVIFSPQLLSYASAIKTRMTGLIAVAVIVSLTVAFVLGRASAFMLRLRTREFGTYLTLGMKRKQIISMFTAENLLIALVSLASGIGFGLVLYQGLIGIVTSTMGFQVSLGSYSLRGLLLTVGLTAGTFLFSTVSASFYLRKVSIYELLYAEKKVSSGTKHPAIWTIITIIALAGVIFSIKGTGTAVKGMFSPDVTDATANLGLIGSLALLFASVFIFYFSFAKSAIHILLHNKKLKNRGTNGFLLRELSAQMGTNAVICSIIALLMTATVLCTNICFGERILVDFTISHDLPFDASVDLDRLEEKAPYSYEEARNMIDKASPIVSEIPYTIYTTGNNQLYQFTPWVYDDLYDSVITESAFNELMTSLGYEPVCLKDSFVITGHSTNLAKCDFTGAELAIGGKTYTLEKVDRTYPSLGWRYYFLAVVPDEALPFLKTQYRRVGIMQENHDYNAVDLNEALSFPVTYGPEGETENWSPVDLQAWYEDEENSMVAVLIVGELYMAVIFVFLATSILTMKLLSELPEVSGRYELLRKLGLSYEERKRTLRRSTFTMFCFPLVLPLLLSIPIALIGGFVVTINGYDALVTEFYASAAWIAGTLIFVQLIYFYATYYMQKKALVI